MPELTLPLQQLSGPSPTVEMIKVHTPVLERFVAKLYGMAEEAATVDAARFSLFFSQRKRLQPPATKQ